MISSDLTTRSAGHQAGHLRGRQDAAAELAGRSTRDPSHRGHPGEPPAGGNAEWVDGFLDGYAVGRNEIMRGEVA